MDRIWLRNYEIVVNGDPSIFADKLFSKKEIALILMDENTKALCYPVLADFVKNENHIVLPAGEMHKNLESCKMVWERMVSFGATRKSLMINLGGGMITDVGSFCAATFMRGIPFVQIPTTLLAMVDAAIGGKTGVDFNHLKNYIGVFRDPHTIYVHPPFLQSLPYRELRSGFAEVIKHGIIGDRGLWEELIELNDLESAHLDSIIARAIRVKCKIVEEDPFESRLRKILNFGHTAGHALESLSLSRGTPFLHGEAVAMGMAIAILLSVRKVLFPEKEAERIIRYLRKLYQFQPIENGDTAELIRLMKRDKKNASGEILFVLLRNIGVHEIDVAIHEDEFVQVFSDYNTFV